MAIGDISSTTQGQFQFGQSAPAQIKPAHSPDPKTTDEVKVSPVAQAKSLYTSGQSVATIAASLGLSTELVDEYLGITTAEEKSLLAVAQQR